MYFSILLNTYDKHKQWYLTTLIKIFSGNAHISKLTINYYLVETNGFQSITRHRV